MLRRGKDGEGGKEERGRHADQSAGARVGKNRAVSHTYSGRKEEKVQRQSGKGQVMVLKALGVTGR